MFRGLLSVHSRYGLHARQVAQATLYTGGSDGFVTSAAAPIATEWSEPVLGRDFHPQLISAFHGAGVMEMFQQLSILVTDVTNRARLITNCSSM
jgi:hypothetical protein